MSARDLPLTRRRVLAGGLAMLAACTPSHRRSRSDPDAVALATARAGELAILHATEPDDPAYAVHIAHLEAVGGTVPAATPSPPLAASGAALARAGVPSLQAAANAMRDGGNAAVLASIAASHASLPVPPR